MADDGGLKGHDAAAIGKGLGDFWGYGDWRVGHLVTVSWSLVTVYGCQVERLLLLIAHHYAARAISSVYMAR
jgi:hypothetical protein